RALHSFPTRRSSDLMTASSWPTPAPPVTDRIQALLARVRRLPARLARAGMLGVRALGFDHPNEALDAAHEIYTMARPIQTTEPRSEEHTSELQSLAY